MEILQTILWILGAVIGVAILGFILLLAIAMNAYWQSDEGRAKLELSKKKKK
jgi:hypothetical protein